LWEKVDKGIFDKNPISISVKNETILGAWGEILPRH